jgi:hypothetical protein
MDTPPYKTTPESGATAAEAAISEMVAALNAEKITPVFIAKKLRKELNACETKVFTPNEKQATVILGAFVAALSKMDPLPEDAGEEVKAKRQKYIEKSVEKMLPKLLLYSKRLIAWDVRQKARQDAHKLRGDYPPEKREIGGFGGEPITLTVKYDGKPNGTNDSSAGAPQKTD